MTTINRIIEELNNRGFIASESHVIKNGIEKTGISIKRTDDQKICPVFYITEGFLEEFDTAPDAVDFILRALDGKESIDIGSPDLLTDPNFIIKNCFIACQRASSEPPLIRRISSLDPTIEEYIYVRQTTSTGDNWSMKITPQVLDASGLELDSLWEQAEKNTFSTSEVDIQPLSTILAALCGEDDIPDIGNSPALYCITNQRRYNGAIQAANKEVIRKFAKEHSYEKLICIPSSIHESLLLGVNGEYDLDQLSDMVVAVNNESVKEEEWLSDHAFLLNVA